ncbi:MAG: hypothetical protein ACRDWD_15865 [Acidimicrobiia bacterium]
MRRARGRVGLAAVSFVVVAAVLRVAVVPPERCPEASTADRRGAVDAAVTWLDRNQEPDGSWVYGYDTETDDVNTGYNFVRHSGVVLSLYQAAGAEVVGARPLADRGLRFARHRLVTRDNWAAFGWPGAHLETGATALLTAAVLERRSTTGRHDLDRLARQFGNFLTGQVRSDGAVLSLWNPDTEMPVPDQYDRFATGETLWALARLHNAFPAAGWDEPARRIADYVATRRDREERRFPYLSDHWSAYALDEMARWPSEALDDAQVAYARRLAGILGVQVRYESQRRAGGLTRLVRGPFAPGSGLGTLGEGFAALDRLGTVDPRLESLRESISVRSDCVAGLLVERQVSAAEADESTSPELAEGAWFHEGVTRMDDQQHAISALLAAPAP